MGNKKLLILFFSFCFLGATSVFATQDAMGFQSIYDKVIELLLNPYVSKIVFAGLFVTGLIAIFKMGGIAGFITLIIMLALGFTYLKLDVLIDNAVTGAIF